MKALIAKYGPTEVSREGHVWHSVSLAGPASEDEGMSASFLLKRNMKEAILDVLFTSYNKGEKAAVSCAYLLSSLTGTDRAKRFSNAHDGRVRCD